jgi:hypothetical protein
MSDLEFHIIVKTALNNILLTHEPLNYKMVSSKYYDDIKIQNRELTNKLYHNDDINELIKYIYDIANYFNYDLRYMNKYCYNSNKYM